MCELCVANCPCPPAAFDAPSPALKLTISAPTPFKKSRLVGSMKPRVGIFSYRFHHAGMRKTAAQHTAQRLSKFFISCSRIHVQRGLCCQNHTAQAISALCRSFIDERLLNRMQFLRSAQTFERRNLVARDG